MISNIGFVDGKEIALESGRIARQGNGVLISSGGSCVLCTCVVGKKSGDGSFIPLSVYYQERAGAAGKFPGGFNKREGKPSEQEVLSSRIIDRSLRPIINNRFCNEIQVVCTVLSYGSFPCDILAIAGAVASCKIAGVPLQIIAGSRAKQNVNGELSINSIKKYAEEGIDFVQTCSKEKIVMLEVGAFHSSYVQIKEAQGKSFSACLEMIALIEGFVKKHDFKELECLEFPSEIEKSVEKLVQPYLSAMWEKDKAKRRENMQAILDSGFSEMDDDKKAQAQILLKEKASKELKKKILSSGTRLDGRKFDELREISAEVGILQGAHGSSLFTRGSTQSLAMVTLGAAGDEQLVDSLDGQYKEDFMLHYNFPSYSVGEVGRYTGPGRREIGHGRLAWKGIAPIIPKDFGNVIRIVSEITESDGSSSMASVCSASLGLMDAGVPISQHCAGISVGLIEDGQKGELIIDITGEEDAFGAMDFKIAGTKKGLNAIQLDVKNDGITHEVFCKAIENGINAIDFILRKMELCINKPNELGNVPKTHKIKIDSSKIGLLIGKGGATIKGICEGTGAKINICDDGEVQISSKTDEVIEEALKRIELAIQPIDRRKPDFKNKRMGDKKNGNR